MRISTSISDIIKLYKYRITIIIMKRGNKKAQFYLVAAVIIMMIVFGLFSASNYVKVEKGEAIVYDLNKELKYESVNVDKFGIHNEKDTHALIENWTKTYVEGMLDKNIETWVIIYGDSSNATVMVFSKESAGTVSMYIGGGTGISTSIITPTIKGATKSYTNVGDEIEVKLDNQKSIKVSGLSKNQQFAALVHKGTYVSSSENDHSTT